MRLSLLGALVITLPIPQPRASRKQAIKPGLLEPVKVEVYDRPPTSRNRWRPRMPSVLAALARPR